MTAKPPLIDNHLSRKAAEIPEAGGAVAKYRSRPSAQYCYEHYDPTSGE
jgi:hypothetical protein